MVRLLHFTDTDRAWNSTACQVTTLCSYRRSVFPSSPTIHLKIQLLTLHFSEWASLSISEFTRGPWNLSHIAPDLSNGEFFSATEILLFQSITEVCGVCVVPREATLHEAAHSSRRGFVLHAERWNWWHNTGLCPPQAVRKLSWPTGSLWWCQPLRLPWRKLPSLLNPLVFTQWQPQWGNLLVQSYPEWPGYNKMACSKNMKQGEWEREEKCRQHHSFQSYRS